MTTPFEMPEWAKHLKWDGFDPLPGIDRDLPEGMSRTERDMLRLYLAACREIAALRALTPLPPGVKPDQTSRED